MPCISDPLILLRPLLPPWGLQLCSLHAVLSLHLNLCFWQLLLNLHQLQLRKHQCWCLKMLLVSGVCSIGRRQKNLLLKTLLEGFHFCHFETLWAPLRKQRICGKITALITLARISLTSFTNLVSLVLVMVVWDQGGDGGGGVEEIHLGNFSLKAQGVTFHGLRRYMVFGWSLGPFQPSPPPYFPLNSP